MSQKESRLETGDFLIFLLQFVCQYQIELFVSI